MDAIKTVVSGRTFFVDPCPECGKAEVRIRDDGTAYGVCPCCDSRTCFPDEHVREYHGCCSVCGEDIGRNAFAVGSLCPNCAAIERHERNQN